MTLNQTSPTKLSLTVLRNLRGAPVETLNPPMTEEAVSAWLSTNGFSPRPSSDALRTHVKDGLYVKGSEVTPQLQRLLAATLKHLHQVKDEHMPSMSVVECGFVRVLAFDVSPSGRVHTHVFMRFTIDECPAGRRLASRCQEEAQKAGKVEGCMPVDGATVHHGGKAWMESDSTARVQKLLAILTAS